jgi:general secretion pathway protein D
MKDALGVAMARCLVLAALLAALGLPVGTWAQTPAPPATGPSANAPPADSGEVRSTILRGSPMPPPPTSAPVRMLRGGDITLNFPGVDVRSVAKAILGDTLRLKYAVDPSVQGQITVQTGHPIRRADVLEFFEQALSGANLVLADRAGIYTIVPAASARGEAPVVGPADTGYGNETVPLKFVNAEELRKLLDPLVPNAISVADPTRNVLVVSGTSVQRAALRELIAQFDVDWLRGMSFALFVPQRTDARLIAPELEKLLNAPGSPSAGLVRLIAMDQLNGILAISAQPQYLEDARRFVEVLDREGQSNERRIFIYHVQNGRASDLAKVLDGAFGIAAPRGPVTSIDPTEINDRSEPAPPMVPVAGFLGGGVVTGAPAPPAKPPTGSGDENRQASESGAAGAQTSGGATTITADETNNAIVVFATPRDYALIEDALRKLDVLPLQVMIDASISEVTLNHTLQYGLQWAFQSGQFSGALSQGSPTTTTNPTTGVTTTTNPGPIQNFPGLSFLFQGANFQATLNALSTVTDVTVLSAPKLMVLNNHTATIEVGDQVPISTGSAVSTVTTGAPIVTSIQYQDTGIILKITPRVNSGGLVLLDIAQEVSEVEPQLTTAAIQSPSISMRKISTSVAVQDGETVALGGLIKNEIQKGRSTIPLLGSIPILGHLFGDTTGGLIRTELVVLLTPRVVRTPVDARAITKELREKLEEAAPPPPPNKKRQPFGP